MSDTLLRKKTRLIEIIFSANFTAPQIKFPTEYDLNGVQILQLEIIPGEVVPVSPAGNTVLTYAQLQGLFMTLYTNDPDVQKVDPKTLTVLSTDEGQYIYQVPATSLIATNFNSTAVQLPFAPTRFRMFGQSIQWSKCVFDIVTAIGNGNNPVSVLLMVDYQGQSRG